MILKSALLVLFCVFAGSSFAQSIPLDRLANLDTRFESISLAGSLQGQPVTATVSYQRGEAFTLLAPRAVQQLDYLVTNGASVQKQQAIALLGGPELHHFLLEYQTNRSLMLDAKRRFDSNKKLYQENAINAGQWREISEAYYQSYLEHEHMQHFFRLVLKEDEQLDQITIAAPIDGRIEFSAHQDYVAEGQPIAFFIPEDAIRLKASIPLQYRNTLSKLGVGRCQLDIDELAAVADGFFVQAWSEPLSEDCRFVLGQTLLAIPVLAADGYLVPKTAVFRWLQRDALFVRQGDELILVYVQLVGESKDNYVVTSEQPLQDLQVLSSSISATQGMLLGLGDE